jgi:hypothetical protein
MASWLVFKGCVLFLGKRLETKMTIRLSLLVVVGMMSGCSITQVATQGFSEVPDGARVAIVRPDIKFYLVSTGGVPEPEPDWTAAAREKFDVALANYVALHNMKISSPAEEQISDTLFEYTRLHSAVGTTIQENHFGCTKLPSKRIGRGRDYEFDWSLGKGMSELGLDADYALFVHYQDYQASGGRVGMAILAAALSVPVYFGHQGGFASLVELKTGNIVWYNNVPAATGDLRTDVGAEKIVGQLFKGLNPEQP